MRNFGRMLIGVIAGILGALVLTLNVWGDEWYKVVISVLAGGMLGSIVANPKTMFFALANAGLFFNLFMARLQSADETQREKRKLITFTFIFAICIAILALSATVAILTITSNLAPDASWWNIPIVIAYLIVIVFIVCVLAMSISPDFFVHIDEARFEKIWGKKTVKEITVGENIVHHELKFKDMIYGLSFGRALKASLISSVIVFANLIGPMLLLLLSGVLAVIVWPLTFIPLLPFWLIREIGRNGQLLAVFVSVVVGASLGTIFHSYFIGLGSGILLFALSYFLNQVFEQIDLLFAFRPQRLVGKLWNSIN